MLWKAVPFVNESTTSDLGALAYTDNGMSSRRYTTQYRNQGNNRRSTSRNEVSKLDPYDVMMLFGNLN